MGDASPEKRSGCGLLNAVLGRRTVWPRRSTSTGSFQPNHSNPTTITRVPSSPIPKRSSDQDSNRSDNNKPSSDCTKDRIVPRPGPSYSKSPPVYNPHGPPNPTRTNPVSTARSQQQGYNQAKRGPQPGLGISGELESMIQDHQRSNRAGNLVRASSSNVMLASDLGNLRQATAGGNNNNEGNRNNVVNDYVYPKNVKKSHGPQKPDSLCRALSTRMDPEQLKALGNEDYKNGRFAEALALYDAAMSIDPNKASYRSNKSAALTALGKLLEAAFECREAIRIDPFYHRAHNRLATLYVRLGEAEKAMHHFKQSGPESDPDAMSKAKRVQVHLERCTEAKRQRDWNSLLVETGLAITAGADSAP